MATDPTVERLTLTHRQAQLQLRNLTIAETLVLARALDPDDLERTWPAVEAALLALIVRRRRESAGLASGYYTTVRNVQQVPGRTRIVLADGFDRDAVARWLLFTGPVTANRYGMNTALTRLAGATSRHVLNGGRQTITETIRQDAKALGWERVTDGQPCAFCAMLASRGAVYKNQSTGGFRAHDHCGCSAEPRFLNDDRISDRNREFRRIWNENTRNLEPGDTQLNAFRRAYSGT